MKTHLLLSFIGSVAFMQAQNNFKYLDINQVKAGISNNGFMHYDPVTRNPSYEVPAGSGTHSDYLTSLWVGGYDSNNTLHLAAQTYGQSTTDFWPGPLDTTNAAISQSVSSQYDRIWKLNRSDIDQFITNFNNGNVQNGSYTPVPEILSWPAHGTGAQAKNLAPFVDRNGNHIYDPLTGGDYPDIKGDQQLFYIFNDNRTHGSSGVPMKIEVHASAYAYGNSLLANQNPVLSNATFYQYKIINRSSSNYHNVFITLYTEADLGYYGDDYIGCDVQGNYGFVYNADNYDESAGGQTGYGSMPPAAGYQVIRGPYDLQNGIDDDGDGIIDEPCEQMGMTRFNYFNNSLPGIPVSQVDPWNAAEYFKYMTGYWLDNTSFTCGGNGYGGTIPTAFVYPGVSYTNSACGTSNWSEVSEANSPGDRKYMISIGPLTLNAGASTEIQYVHCTSFPSGGINAIERLKTDMQALKAFNNIHDPLPLYCGPVSVKEQDEWLDMKMYPNPATKELNLSFNESASSVSRVSVTDIFGKLLFEKQSDGSGNMSLDVSTMASGVYFVKISGDGKSVVRKFIRQ